MMANMYICIYGGIRVTYVINDIVGIYWEEYG